MKKNNETNHVPPKVWKSPFYFLAFGLGSGAIPVMPGTFGTLFAIPFYLLLAKLPVIFYFVVWLLLTVGSIFICDRVSNDLKVHDHSGITLDEFCGFWLTMLAAPQGWQWILLGFVLFRLFDIVKPFPIRWLDQNIKGGLGIVIDDVAAGLYALAVMQVVKYIWG